MGFKKLARALRGVWDRPGRVERRLGAGFSYALEALEPRTLLSVTIGPTGHTATYPDVDGDAVTVSVSAGTLTPANFTTAALGSGDQLQLIDLTDPSFNGASVTVSATRAGNGDGLVNIGRINAGTNNMGIVTIKGDLTVLDAGSGSALVPAVQSLGVRSMGLYGLLTQGGSGDLESDIVGRLAALKVTADVKGAFIFVSGGAPGTIGSIAIGGSLIGGDDTRSGEIACTGDMGVVTIGHDIQAGAGSQSGVITSGSALAAITIGGSLIGGFSGATSGIIAVNGNIGPVKIAHDIRGGAAVQSGRINSIGALAGLTVGGSIIGGGGDDSGEVTSGSDMGAVTIGGDLQGGAGADSGRIFSAGTLASLTIRGSLLGSGGLHSGEVQSTGNMGAVHIAVDILV